MIPLTYLPQSLNISLGTATIVLNLLIFLAIAKERKMRHQKEYLVIGALAFTDVLFGINYVGVGMERIYIYLTNQQPVLMSTWECMIRPLSFFKLYGVQLSSVMLACVSTDRMLAVARPLWYFKQKIGYAKRLIGLFYGLALLNSSALVFVSYQKRHVPLYPESCGGANIVGKGLAARYLMFSRIIFPVISVLLYASIPLIHWKSAPGADMGAQARKINRQRRLVKTLGLSAFFTLLLYILPNLIKLTASGGGPESKEGGGKVFSQLINSATLMNSIANFFLYTMRHKHMNDAVKKLLRFRAQKHTKTGAPAKPRKAF